MTKTRIYLGRSCVKTAQDTSHVQTVLTVAGLTGPSVSTIGWYMKASQDLTCWDPELEQQSQPWVAEAATKPHPWGGWWRQVNRAVIGVLWPLGLNLHDLHKGLDGLTLWSLPPWNLPASSPGPSVLLARHLRFLFLWPGFWMTSLWHFQGNNHSGIAWDKERKRRASMPHRK